MKNFAKSFSYYVILFLTVAAIAFPVYWMAVSSLQTREAGFQYPPQLFPTEFDVSSYSDAFSKGNIFTWVRNSLIVALGVVIFNLINAVPAAYAIAKTRFKLSNVLLFLVLATQMVPPPLLVVPLFVIFRTAGLINNFISLILADSILTLPLAAWVLVGFFENLPDELSEAARIDGCSRYGVFFRIALPLTKPAIVTVSLFTFYDVWNEYLFGVTFMTDQSKWVGSVGLASFVGQFVMRWKPMMTHSLLFSIIPLVIYFFARNQILKGAAQGFMGSK